MHSLHIDLFACDAIVAGKREWEDLKMVYRGERHVCAWHSCECFAHQDKQKNKMSFLLEASLGDAKSCRRAVSFDTV